MNDYYQILGVERNADFETLRKAYYRKAKTCHPDLHGGSAEMNEVFRRIVEAFNVLSDPMRRASFDRTLGHSGGGSRSCEPDTVMDSDSDDTLEELIVGNRPPENTTLLTLFLDLEKTFVFITWREARNYYWKRQYRLAMSRLNYLVKIAPSNILYRVYLGRCLRQLGHYGPACRQFRAAIRIGDRRIPPQRLGNVRRELEKLSGKRSPLLHRILRFFLPFEDNAETTAEDEMIQDTNRALAKLVREEEAERTRKLGR